MEKKDVARIIKRLEHREKENVVEVEHILKLVRKGDSSLIEPLKKLSQKHKWEQLNDNLIVPLASWIDIVCDYFAGGIPKMVEIAKHKDRYSRLSLAVLEELKTNESIEALIEIFQLIDLENEKDLDFAYKVISAFNLAASFGKDLQFSEEFKNKSQSLLLKGLSVADKRDDNRLRGVCILSFRGVGNNEIIAHLKARRPMDYPYLGIEKIVIREILKRKDNSKR